MRVTCKVGEGEEGRPPSPLAAGVGRQAKDVHCWSDSQSKGPSPATLHQNKPVRDGWDGKRQVQKSRGSEYPTSLSPLFQPIPVPQLSGPASESLVVRDLSPPPPICCVGRRGIAWTRPFERLSSPARLSFLLVLWTARHDRLPSYDCGRLLRRL